MEGRVSVFARVRGLMDRERGAPIGVVCDEEKKTILVEDMEGAVEASLAKAPTGPIEKKPYEFDGVFGPDSTQTDVFKAVGLPVMNAALRGFNGCVFAYGMTGSGKTYSLLNSDANQAGLLPRLVATMYARAGFDGAHAFLIEAAALQVYNEQVDDLLTPQYLQGAGRNLAVSKGVAEKATWKACSTSQECLELFVAARKNIIYAETKMNKASSRSHALFQLRISKRPKAGGKSTRSLLSVVDLAGSERVKRSGVEGKEFKEAVNINGSLLALGQVVSALAAQKKHVPFRDSKLTRLLETSLGGNCVTTLLACASPSADSTSETISAFGFAQRAMRVEVKASVNECTLDIDFGALSKSLVAPSADAVDKEVLKQTELRLKEKDAAVGAARKSEEEARKRLQEQERKAQEMLEVERKKAADAWKEREVELEKGERAKRESIMESEKQAASLRESVASLATKLQAAAQQEKQRVEALTSERDHKTKVEAELAESKQQLKAASTAASLAKKQASESIAKAKADLAVTKKQLEQKHAEQKKVLESQYAQELKLKDMDYVQRVEALEKEATQKITELERSKEAELAELKKRHTEELAERTRASSSASDNAKRRATEMEKARQEHAEFVGNLEKRHIEDLACVAAETRKAEERASDMGRALEETRVAFDEAKQSAEAALKAVSQELDERNTDVSKKLAELEELSNGLKGTESAKSQLEMIVADLQRRQAEAEVHELRLSKAKAEIADALTATQRELEAESKHKDALTGQLAALEERSIQESEKFEAYRQTTEQQREQREAKHAHEMHVAEERHVEELEVTVLKHETAQRRQSACFSAARHLEQLKRENVEQRLDHIIERFTQRAARDEDIAQIQGLRSSLSHQAYKIAEKEREARRIQLELEHERATDRIFGAQSHKRAVAGPKPASTPKLRPRTSKNRRALTLQSQDSNQLLY